MPLSADYISNRNITVKKGRKVVVAALVYQSWVDVLAAVTNWFAVSHAGAGAAGTVGMVMAHTTTDYPRNVVITVTHATAVVAMSGTITGTDLAGKNISEDWAVTAGTTTKTFTGKKAFKTVTGITETVAADASANSIIAGTGVVLGLNSPLSVASAVKEVAAGSVVTNGTFVKASAAATDDPHGTYSPNTAPNGTNDYEAWYISNYPESGR
jgi:hypothetical protein